MWIKTLFLMALSAQAVAQVYKWVDENGVTHFGSAPPTAQHEEVELGRTNTTQADGRTPPAYHSDSSFSHERARRSSGSVHTLDGSSLPNSGPSDYICQGAQNRLRSAQERWDSAKRRGYTQSERQYYEQLIRDSARHRDNICR